MLVIDNLQNLICYDHAVAGAEAVLYPSGKVQPLFDQYLRIRTMLLCRLDLLRHIIPVAFRAVLHFLIVVGKILCRILHIPSKGLLYQIGAQFMTVGTLLRIGTRPILLL